MDKQVIDCENVINLVRTYFDKGKIAIYSELSDTEYKELEGFILNSYANNQDVSFVKCSYFPKDIEEYALKRQISFFS